MQNSPLVTVICMCYNHADFVAEALNSVINQDFSNIELIVTDDGSTDNSVTVIEKWLVNHPEVLFIKNEGNEGNTKIFNKAFRQSKGDFIIDLAADDVLLPDCISKQLTAFQNSEFSNLGMVYGNVENINADGSFHSYYFPVDDQNKVLQKRTTGNIYKEVLTGESICSVSAMIKRDVLEHLNGYDETLAYEDLDLWIRASRLYHFYFIDAVLVKKRIVPTSLTHDFFRKKNVRTRQVNRSTYQIIQKAMKLNTTSEENKALLKRVHYEMINAWRTSDYALFLRYIPVELKLRFS